MTTALAIRDGGMSREHIELLKTTICAGATDAELALFVESSKRLGLDPFARQIFAVKRWDGKAGREVMAIQVSVDGFRLVAERTGKYAGQLGPFWTADGKEWLEVWLSREPPAAAKVAVLRHDFKEPIWSVATWEQYKQEGKNGLSPMWRKMGPLMLAKCAESLALRRAFPNELSGVYTQEEMAQAEPQYTPPPTTSESPADPEREEDRARFASAMAEPPAKPFQRADKVPAKDGEALATKEQLARIHILLKETGTTDDAYRKGLRAYKRHDGKPCEHANELTGVQADNLIRRLEALRDRQQARFAKMEAEAEANVAALGGEAKTQDVHVDPRVRFERALTELFTGDNADMEENAWLQSLGFEFRGAVPAESLGMVTELLLAYKMGPVPYKASLAKARALGHIPQETPI